MSRILMFVLAAGVSVQAALQPTPTASSDSEFLVKAADAAAKEFEVGKMASERGSNPDVKAFGRRLVVDHSILNGELQNLSRSRNVVLPRGLKTDPTELIVNIAQPHSMKIDLANMPAGSASLMSLEGPAFDRAFIDQMVKGQQDVVALFGTEARGGKDNEVKEWAENKLVTLKGRLNLAKDLQEKMSR